jgi:hypothetical protein
MIFAVLLFITGITLSAVAIYYSVLGLTAIFAAAFWPVVVMGVTLETAKLVAASWLKYEWKRIPILLKTYLSVAVAILMIITSMGIFGFLSKSFLDQNLVSGDVASQLYIVDEKIRVERENISNAQSVIKQMDDVVNGIMSTGDQEIKLRDGSTQVRSAAERALQVRRSQSTDRNRLTKEIEEAQSRILKLQEESAPVRTQLRKVEAEVGPIKYIAKMIYGDSLDQNILEKAVSWVIILIVIVFDPLAVLLLISAQMAFQWRISNQAASSEETPDPYVADVGEKPTAEELEDIDTAPISEPIGHHSNTSSDYDVAVEVNESEKDLYDQGNIDSLDQSVVEQLDETILDESPKKKDLHDKESGYAVSEGEEVVAYVQNQEQSEGTLWSRLSHNDQLKAIDRLYKEYSDNSFEGLVVDKVTEKDLYNFIEETKFYGPRFNNYGKDKLEHFAERIYELRKNQPDNSAR